MPIRSPTFPGSRRRRIIAIGRDSSISAKKRAFEQGANVYAVMPFTKKNILGILDSVLSPIDDLDLPFYTSDIPEARAPRFVRRTTSPCFDTPDCRPDV
jgi:hypothetical protein